MAPRAAGSPRVISPKKGRGQNCYRCRAARREEQDEQAEQHSPGGQIGNPDGSRDVPEHARIRRKRGSWLIRVVERFGDGAHGELHNGLPLKKLNFTVPSSKRIILLLDMKLFEDKRTRAN
jgi:hypothetical protein